MPMGQWVMCENASGSSGLFIELSQCFPLAGALLCLEMEISSHRTQEVEPGTVDLRSVQSWQESCPSVFSGLGHLPALSRCGFYSFGGLGVEVCMYACRYTHLGHVCIEIRCQRRCLPLSLSTLFSETRPELSVLACLCSPSLPTSAGVTGARHPA